MTRGRTTPAKVLVTVSSACPDKKSAEAFCDAYSGQLGTRIARNLDQSGFSVYLVTNDAVPVVTAGSSEARQDKFPARKEILRRTAKLMSEGVLTRPSDAYAEIAKVLKFREDVEDAAERKPNVHIDIHSFGGCSEGVGRFDCGDFGLVTVPLYGNTKKLSRAFAKRASVAGMTIGFARESKARNDLVSRSKISHSMIISLNRDMIDESGQKRSGHRVSDVARKITPIIAEAIGEVTRRPASVEHRDTSWGNVHAEPHH